MDDFNLGEVKKCEKELADCHRKLLAASSWATMFRERALQTELTVAKQKNNELTGTTTVRITYDTSNNILPLVMPLIIAFLFPWSFHTGIEH